MDWISCEERLPKEGDVVLVWILRYGGSEDYRLSSLDNDCWEIENEVSCEITHWMKIEPPKEK
ncbi:DUF551 domain-containing protein [Candidatus Oleimmundimicrobium sp.]|uniref:DUF551 domain-containing protein n=1 Tax=Candidatus Oleimmundimicrobium sp. TaxID=3060597 RepID=UPI00271E312D|nr:DUF551 domain-containing protein [Candidatus Oleimmundimicrobium sp.]MDO8885753.1 DUF551 domain-containing protein [Candidatus Oleimmundimicrobium sp.]